MSSNDPWSSGWTKRRAASRDAHIESQRTDHQIPVAVSLRALGLSASWFYKHRGWPPTWSRQRREALDAAVVEVFAVNDCECGSPRVHAELVERSEWAALSVNTVAERMQVLELVGNCVAVGR